MTNETRDEAPGPVPPATEQELVAAAPRAASRRELWVGIFAIAAVLGSVILLLQLTDASLFRGRYKVTTTVADAGGLRGGDSVQMRGVNIGRVTDFSMVAGGVKITLELEGQYRVPVDSRVELRSAGLLGGRVAEVVPGSSPASLRDGMSLEGESVADLSASTAELSTGAKQALRQVNALLSPENVEAVGQSARDLQATLRELSAIVAEQREQVASLTASLNRSAAALEGATSDGQLEALTARMNRTMARIDATAASLDRAGTSLEIVIGRVERGEGTLGKLVRDDELYDNLNDAAEHLDALIVDIKANPKRYVTVEIF